MGYMPNGNAVANLSLATDESYNDRQTGQKVEQTEWHRITVYGKLAEIVQQYLKKGARAYFEGKLRTREWEKDGIKRYTTEIIANDMLMLDGRNGGDMGNAGMNGGYQQPQNAAGMMAPASGMSAAPQGNQGYGQAPQQPAQQPSPQQPSPQQSAPVQSGYGQAPQQPAPQQPAPQRAPAQGGYSQPPQQPAPQPAPAQGGYQQPPQQQPSQQAPRQAAPQQPAPQHPAPQQQPAQTPPPAN